MLPATAQRKKDDRRGDGLTSLSTLWRSSTPSRRRAQNVHWQIPGGSELIARPGQEGIPSGYGKEAAAWGKNSDTQTAELRHGKKKKTHKDKKNNKDKKNKNKNKKKDKKDKQQNIGGTAARFSFYPLQAALSRGTPSFGCVLAGALFSCAGDILRVVASPDSGDVPEKTQAQKPASGHLNGSPNGGFTFKYSCEGKP